MRKSDYTINYTVLRRRPLFPAVDSLISMGPPMLIRVRKWFDWFDTSASVEHLVNTSPVMTEHAALIESLLFSRI